MKPGIGNCIFLLIVMDYNVLKGFVMEQESKLEHAILLISEDQLSDALEIISEYLLHDCIQLMASMLKDKNRYELYSLYYDNYLDFAKKVKEGKFQYASDAAMKSFFKTGCSHRAKEQINSAKKTNDWLSIDFFEKSAGEYADRYEAEKNAEYERVKDKYGIDLASVETEEVFPMEVISAFHSLNEKCKFLVVLKYMLNLSHKNIVDCLSNFYELKNENVSKTELKRCLDQLKKKSISSQN